MQVSHSLCAKIALGRQFAYRNTWGIKAGITCNITADKVKMGWKKTDAAIQTTLSTQRYNLTYIYEYSYYRQ